MADYQFFLHEFAHAAIRFADEFAAHGFRSRGAFQLGDPVKQVLIDSFQSMGGLIGLLGGGPGVGLGQQRSAVKDRHGARVEHSDEGESDGDRDGLAVTADDLRQNVPSAIAAGDNRLLGQEAA